MQLNQKQILLVILMLVSTLFFGYTTLLPHRPVINTLCVTIFGYLFFTQVKYLRSFTEGKLLCLYLLFFLFSCVYSIVFNGQSPMSLYQGVVNYMGLMTFVYCYKNSITYDEVKKTLFTFAIIFCLSYIIQWVIYPKIIFQGAAADGWSEERFRMRLPASLCAFYMFLSGVSCIIERRFLRAAACIVLGGIPIIVMGFRSLTFLTIVASVLLYLQNSKLNFKSIGSAIVIVAAAFAISQTSLFNNKLAEMQSRQESDAVFSNEDYIRWVELDFYRDYFSKPGEWLFGGGVPSGLNHYSLELQSFLDMGLYWQDLGIIGLSFIIGIITVCILVFWSLRMMARCGHLDLGVERMTMFIALFGSIITSMEYFRPGNFMILGLLFYCEYIHNRELGAPSDKFWLRKHDYYC